MTFIGISYKDLLSIHDSLIRLYGGLDGVKDRNLLLSTLEGYKDDFYFPTPESKISKIVINTIQFHPFNDGNKRTGITLLVSLCYMNKLNLIVSPDRLTEVANLIAMNKYSRELLEERLTKNLPL